MPSCPQTTRSLPFLADFPDAGRQSVEQALDRQDERQRKTSDSIGEAVDRAAEDLQRQLRDLLGAGEVAELRQQIRRERLAFRDLWQPPDGLERDYDKQRKASRRRVAALVGKLGIDPAELEKLQRGFRDRLDELLTPGGGKVVPGYHLASHLDKWTNLSPLHAFPLPWGVRPPADDPRDPHRWLLVRPPFFGFLFGFTPQATSNFQVDRQLFLHPASGLVGNEATMDCVDAGSYDVASVTAESQVAFGFVAPTAGLVEVLVDAQSTMAVHDLEIEDEFGFSGGFCHQNNYLMMDVLHPNVPEPSLALMSNLSRETEGDDVKESRENLTRGQHYFAHLFSSGPVPAGQHVVVTVGTRTFDIAYANDMDLHSTTNFQWFINSVEVRIAP